MTSTMSSLFLTEKCYCLKILRKLSREPYFFQFAFLFLTLWGKKVTITLSYPLLYTHTYTQKHILLLLQRLKGSVQDLLLCTIPSFSRNSQSSYPLATPQTGCKPSLPRGLLPNQLFFWVPLEIHSLWHWVCILKFSK